MKNKLVYFILILMIVVSLNLRIYATDACNITINVSKTEVNPEGSVSVTVSLNNIESTDGIGTIIATLEYDRDIFEVVTKNDITLKSDWNSLSYNESNGKIIIQKDEGISTNHDVFEVNLSVKTDAEAKKDITIKLTDINISDGSEDFFLEDSYSQSIQVVEKTSDKEDPIVEEPTEEMQQQKESENQKDLTTANKRLPQTGERGKIIAISIIIILMLSIIIFKNRKK